MIGEAIPLVRSADIFVVVGTSLVVYPAAGLVHYVQPGTPVYVVDKKIPYIGGDVVAIEKPATEGITELAAQLLASFSPPTGP